MRLTMLQNNAGVAWAEMTWSVVFLLLSVWGLARQGCDVGACWFYMIAFAAFRLAGACAEEAAERGGGGDGGVTPYVPRILGNLSLIVLFPPLVGYLEWLNDLPTTISLPWCALGLLNVLFGITVLVATVTEVVTFGPSSGEERTARVVALASVVFLSVILTLVCGVVWVALRPRRPCRRSHRVMFWATVMVIVLMAVRLAYWMIKISDPGVGNLLLRIFMATVPDHTAALIYVGLGLWGRRYRPVRDHENIQL